MPPDLRVCRGIAYLRQVSLTDDNVPIKNGLYLGAMQRTGQGEGPLPQSVWAVFINSAWAIRVQNSPPQYSYSPWLLF